MTDIHYQPGEDSSSNTGGFSNLPTDLYRTNQWICWRFADRGKADSKPVKIPVDPETGEPCDVTEPGIGTDLVSASIYHLDGEIIEYGTIEETDTDGIGFVFTSDDPFVGLDLDDCIRPDGWFEPWASAVIEQLGTYTEYSPSGRGLHCICKGSLPEGNVRSEQVEMYEESRYFTVTAHPVRTPNLLNSANERTDELRAVFNEHFPSNESPNESDNVLTTGDGGNSLSDEDVLQRARNAANGEKFERLWAGNHENYQSQSEADMALCSMLAFWSGGDAEKIDRLFRRSGLMRDKWDEQRGGRTYGSMTISKAFDVTNDYFSPTG